jgi:hypothetical protein
MALSQTEVSQLYVTLFGRASEGEGNQYWQANASDMVSSANAMLDTDAAKEYFGDTINDNQKFVEFIYLNTLGKTITDDPDGIAYWVAELEAGKSKGEVSVALISATQDPANAGNAQDQFNNKVAVSNDAANKIFAFTTIEKFTSYIKDVDHTPDSVTAATALVDADVVATPGETYTLTTGADALVGTGADDTFNGLAATNSVNGNLMDTFQSVDSINGGNGTDTANLQLGAAGTAVNIGAAISNVEVFNVTSFAGDTLNMANVDSATSLTSKNSVGTLSLTNVGKVIDLGITGSKAALTAGFTTASLAGTADASKISLDTADGGQAITLNGTGTIESLTVDSAGSVKNNVTLAGTAAAGATSLTVTGDGALKMTTTGMTALKTVDASAATGGVSLNVSSTTAANQTITGGTGHDTFTVAGLSSLDTIDGGAGTDTVATKLTASVTTAAAITNVEAVSVSSTGGSWTLNLEKTTELENVQFGPVLADIANVTTITNAAASAKNLQISGTGSTASETLGGASFALKTSTGTTDEVSVVVDNINTLGVHTTKAAGTVQTVTALTLNGFETINIGTADLGATSVVGATTTVGGLSVGTLTATSLKTLNIESDTYVAVGNALGATVKTVDASKTTAGVNLNVGTMVDSTATGTASTSVTTGSGNDTLGTYNTTANVNKAFSTGDGKDTLTIADSTGNQGIVTIDMGAGNDTVTGAGTAATAANAGKAGSTLAFGDGTDTLKSGAADTNLTNFTISGLDAVQVLSTFDLNINAANVTGTALAVSTFSTGYLELIGTTGAEAIDASSFSITGTWGVYMQGLAGADTLSGTSGTDTFTIAQADSNTTAGMDSITNFLAGTDRLDLDVAGTGTVNTGSTNADVSNNSANVASTGTTTTTLLANLQTAADALGANLFDQAGDTFAVTITGASVGGTDVSYVVQNAGADTNVTAADTIIALTGTSTKAITVATII